MKLAEALIERSDLQSKVQALQFRMINNAKIQEGVEPNEKSTDLLNELDEKLERLEYLIIHINKTNEQTKCSNDLTISQMIAKRDIFKKKVSILGMYLNSANQLIERVTHSEIKIVSAFSVVEMQKKIDTLSRELRLIDTKIQEQNWLAELI